MTVSNLDTGQGALWTSVLSGLSGLGYTYNRLTQSRTQFLATAVTGITGSSVSHLRLSLDQLLALLLTNLGGSSVSGLRLSRSQLLAGLSNHFAAGNPPVNTVAPAVTGTATQGQTLSSTTGTWTGDATITYAYQWYQSPSSAIGGATSSTYVLQVGDVGSAILCKVTASNGAGSATASSNTTGTIASSSSFELREDSSKILREDASGVLREAA